MSSPVPLAAFPVGVPTLTGLLGRGTLPARQVWPRLFDDWNLWFIESGQVVWEFKDGRALQAGPDDFLLLPPLTFTRCRTLRAPVRDWFCHFSFRPIPARTIPVRMTEGVLDESHAAPGRTIVVPLRFSRREAPGVWRALRDLLADTRAPHPAARLWRLECAGIRLVSDLTRFAYRCGYAPDDPRLMAAVSCLDPRLVEICAQIRKNPAFRWKIGTIAHSLGLSAGYLHELCQATLGKSLKSHIGEVRMQSALELLRSRGPAGPLSLKEISVACGFSSQPFFNRQFKKFYGIPPALARRQVHLS